MLSKPVLTAAQQERVDCIDALKSSQCRCLRPKQRGMAFCFKCWGQLPDQIRRSLYKRIGEGFEAAYSAACDYLNTNTGKEPNGKRTT